MNEKNKSISERLRILRLANKLTQEEIASKFFLSRSCWANYERGIRCPNYDLLTEISRYFNVEIGYLLNGKAPSAAYGDFADFELLSKDWKVDISKFSVLHKMMVIEFCRCLIAREQEDDKGEPQDIII